MGVSSALCTTLTNAWVVVHLCHIITLNKTTCCETICTTENEKRERDTHTCFQHTLTTLMLLKMGQLDMAYTTAWALKITEHFQKEDPS